MGSTPKGISGSRIGKILGLSNFGTPVSVWIDLMEENYPGFCKENGYEESVFKGNAMTRIGLLFEPLIDNRLEKIYNCKVIDKEKEYQKGILTCHIDGKLETKLNKNELNENKTTSLIVFRKKFGDIDTDQVPAEYIAQCQLQMLLSGHSREYMHVLVFPEMQDILESLINSKNLKKRDLSRWVRTLDEMGFLKRFIIQRNDHMVKIIKETANIWEKKYIKEKTPPDIENVKDYRIIFKNPHGECVVNEELKQKILVKHRVSEQNKRIKAYDERLKKQILEYMMKNKINGKTKKCFLVDKNGYNLVTWNGKSLYFRQEKKT